MTKDTGRLQFAREEENKFGTILWPDDTAQVPNGFNKRDLRLHEDKFQAIVGTLSFNVPFIYEDFDKGNLQRQNFDRAWTGGRNNLKKIKIYQSTFVNGERNKNELWLGPHEPPKHLVCAV